MYTNYNTVNTTNNGSDNVIFHKENEPKSKGNKFLEVIWKILLIILVFVLLFLGLFHFGIISLASSVYPEVIVLNQSEVGIKKGKGYQIVSNVLPENASNKQIIYESSDPSIASVNEYTGYVTAKKNGRAVITVKTLVNEVFSECVINVGNVSIPVNSVNISNNNINLAVGYSETLKYNVQPSNATELKFNFSSSNPSVAKVSSNGIITGVKSGNAIITISNNNNTVTDTAYVTVYQKGDTTVVSGEAVKTDNYPKSINIPSSKSLSIGSTLQLNAVISPSGTQDNITWMSTNPSVATVDSDGTIRANSVGTADIVAKTINNLTSVCHLTVGSYEIKLKKIYITTNYSYLKVGQTRKLYAAYEPTNASNPSITWSSDNPSVVSVDKTGNIKCLKIGSAKITAVASEGGLSDSVTIEVGGDGNIIEVNKIELDATSKTIYVGASEQITPKILPSNATYKALTYTSSDTSIVTVDSNGLIKGLRDGTATITVRTNHENISTNMKITVRNNPATGVELETTSLTLSQNESYMLSAKVIPSNASNKTVTYTSSNSSIVKVDQTGNITGLSKGTATITVTPNGGGASSTCLVTVK